MGIAGGLETRRLACPPTGINSCQCPLSSYRGQHGCVCLFVCAELACSHHTRLLDEFLVPTEQTKKRTNRAFEAAMSLRAGACLLLFTRQNPACWLVLGDRGAQTGSSPESRRITGINLDRETALLQEQSDQKNIVTPA